MGFEEHEEALVSGALELPFEEGVEYLLKAVPESSSAGLEGFHTRRCWSRIVVETLLRLWQG